MDGTVADEAAWTEARRRAALVARTLPDAPAGLRLSLSEATRELRVDRSTACRWRERRSCGVRLGGSPVEKNLQQFCTLSATR
jgi:hypothetical protein